MPANTNEVVGLGASITLDDVFKELKKLGPMTDKEAKAMAAAMDRSAKSMVASNKKAADATKKAAEEAKKLGDASKGAGDRALKAFGPLGGILSRISPEAGAAASSIAAMTSAAEGFEAASVGPLAIAIGAALVTMAAGYDLANSAAEHEIALQQISAEGYAAQLPMLQKIAATKLDLAHATGAISDEEYRRQKITQAAAADLAKATEADVKGITDAANAQASWTTEIVDWLNYLNPLEHAINAITGSNYHLGTTTADLNDIIHAHEKAIAAAGVAADDLTKNEIRLDDANEKNKRSAAGAKDAATALTAANKAAAKAFGDLIDREQAQIDAANESAAATRAAGEASLAADAMVSASAVNQLSAVQQLEDARANAILKYSALAVDAGKTDEQMAADGAVIIADYAKQITAAKAVELKKQTDDAQSAAAATMAIWGTGGQLESSLIGSIDTITQNQLAAHDTTTAAGKAAARKAWETTHALALADAVIQGAIAEMGFISDGAQKGGVIGAAIEGAAGAAVVGAGIAAVATAPAPSYHRGYAPDEREIRALKSEAVLNPTATANAGRAGIDAMNAGQTPQASAPAPIIVGHRVFDALIKRELQNGGALSAALSAGQIVGHRTNRRSTNG